VAEEQTYEFVVKCVEKGATEQEAWGDAKTTLLCRVDLDQYEAKQTSRSSEDDSADVDADDICPDNDGKPHQADWGTAHINEDGQWYIDINCMQCGRSGCVGSEKTLSGDIQW
jgi:hypothetical protein